MNAMDFYTRVRDESRLEWNGVRMADDPKNDEIFVSCPSRRLHFSFDLATIREHSWDEWKPVLTGYRSPRVMTHITRIVGYYSQINNWNRSKKQELIDRHKGKYSVDEVSVKVSAPAPEPVFVVEEVALAAE